MMLKLIVLIFCCISCSVSGQDSIVLIRWKTSDLYPAATTPSHRTDLYAFSVNSGTPQPIGLLGAHLEPYLHTQPVAHRMFLDYRKRAKTRGTVARVSFFAMWAGAAVFIADTWIAPTDNTMSTVGLSLTYAGLGGGIVSLLMRPGVNRRLEQAVDVFNTIE